MTEYGYTRTSTDAQDGIGQRHKLLSAGIAPENIFTDIGISGMKASRPQWDHLLSLLTKGDVLTVPELSRIGRSTINVLKVIEDLESRGVDIRIMDLGLDSTSPIGRATITILCAISRLERDMISSRTKATLAAKKAAGMRLGAVPKVTPRDIASMKMMRESGIPVAKIAGEMKLARSTVYRLTEEPA